MLLCIKQKKKNCEKTWKILQRCGTRKITHWLRQAAAIRLSEPNGAHSLAGG